MEQRDYILREIEKISVVLLAMLGKLKRIDSKKQFEQESELLNGEFKEGVGLSIDEVIQKSNDELSELLTKENGYNEENLGNLAEVLVLFSNNMYDEDRRNLIEKAMFLLEHLGRMSMTFSFERIARIEELKSQL